MNDAEYIFKQTSAERKRNGYGDYHKKRQGGRQVRLPSDHLSKKEIEAMSGECVTYNMKAPVKWSAFKEWPDDIQREYLKNLEDSFHAKTEDVAGMMSTGYDNIRMLKKALGIASGRGGKRPPLDENGWTAFLTGGYFVSSQPLPSEVEKCPETPADSIEKCPASSSEKLQLNSDSIMNLAILLDALKGTGAKLTIEVTL